MVNIKLHGIFENFVKTDWFLNVKTVGEAFEAIEANSNKLIETLGTMQEYLSHFIIYVDDKIIAPEYLNSPILKKNSVVEVVPLILGAEIGLMTMIIVMLIAMGIQMLITRLMSPKAPKDIKNNSRMFSAYENVTKRNVAIPIGYGRLKIGSVLVSNDLITTSLVNQGAQPAIPIFGGGGRGVRVAM
jgi:predicted phage tail protein